MTSDSQDAVRMCRENGIVVISLRVSENGPDEAVTLPKAMDRRASHDEKNPRDLRHNGWLNG